MSLPAVLALLFTTTFALVGQPLPELSMASGRATLTNQAKQALTAYVVEAVYEPCAPADIRPPVPHAFDALTVIGGRAILPGASSTVELGFSMCNKVGARIPARATLRAVVFENGATHGDAGWIQRMNRNRDTLRRAAEDAIAHLKNVAGILNSQSRKFQLERRRLNVADLPGTDPYQYAAERRSAGESAAAIAAALRQYADRLRGN